MGERMTKEEALFKCTQFPARSHSQHWKLKFALTITARCYPLASGKDTHGSNEPATVRPSECCPKGENTERGGGQVLSGGSNMQDFHKGGWSLCPGWIRRGGPKIKQRHVTSWG